MFLLVHHVGEKCWGHFARPCLRFWKNRDEVYRFCGDDVGTFLQEKTPTEVGVIPYFV